VRPGHWTGMILPALAWLWAMRLWRDASDW
jgi:hypothetical protein